MKIKNYKFIIIFITLTVLATIGLQIFWNIKSYKETKNQLIKEVQTAFDNSIEYYYVEDSKNDFVAFVDENETIAKDDFIDNVINDSIFSKNIGKIKRSRTKKANNLKKDTTKIDTSNFKISVAFTSSTLELKDTDIPKKIQDSINQKPKWKNTKDTTKPKSNIEIHGDAHKISAIKVFKGKKATDSISKLTNLINKIIISTFQDSINFEKLSKSVDRELARKNISVDYRLQHFKSDTLFRQFQKDTFSILPLTAVSGTTFIPKEQKLQIAFSDPTLLLLKRSFTEIFLSLLLSLSIISCLIILLKIIQKQKKIDEIKNDLISNITHEFKTPITTISAAIEGIKNFNAVDDKEKTTRYLDVSGQQLNKLKIMVEKLLETASLNTDKLNLNKEEINSVELLKTNIEKHQIATDKEIIFTANQEIILAHVDVFHFENAISNLIDNALKYGGNKIEVAIVQTPKRIEITVEDNGLGIEKSQREKIFEQFYRIPKGNIHDVKGFGIGLYYAKKIIEKHNGTLELVSNTNKTIFKIAITNAF